jgi:hypothetical protein
VGFRDGIEGLVHYFQIDALFETIENCAVPMDVPAAANILGTLGAVRCV